MSLLQLVHLNMISKTATIQYEPVMSLAGNNNALAYYNSHITRLIENLDVMRQKYKKVKRPAVTRN